LDSHFGHPSGRFADQQIRRLAVAVLAAVAAAVLAVILAAVAAAVLIVVLAVVLIVVLVVISAVSGIFHIIIIIPCHSIIPPEN
jgi:ABC-type Co2+ transport system permease subunit